LQATGQDSLQFRIVGFWFSRLADFFAPLFLSCFADLLGSSGLLFLLRWHDLLSSCEALAVMKNSDWSLQRIEKLNGE
jgi:hypothetical protein